MNEREELRKLFLDHPSASMPGLMEFSSTVPEDVEDVDSIIDRILAAGYRKQPVITDQVVKEAIVRFHEPRDESWEDAMRATLEHALRAPVGEEPR